jgi:co-chaperonin GroES (HSP10)
LTAHYQNKIVGDLNPIHDHVLVDEIDTGERVTAAGIMIASDNGLDRGIRPRWCRVWKVGPKQTDVKPGEYLLVEHGKWTWQMDITGSDGISRKIQRVDTTGILMVSDEKPY